LYKNTENFDFYVVTNNKNFRNIYISKKYNIIYDDDIKSPYIGWLKYTKKLPINYDYYLYFDSDILCYEKLENIISLDKDLSLVKEDRFMSFNWFNYPYATVEEKEIFKSINGVNAGTYFFKDTSFLNDVRDSFKNHNISSNGKEKLAMFEQSCFNYSVFKYLLNNEYTDITDYVKLFAKEISNETIYHFCGYEGFMDNKYVRMNNFNNKYKNIN
jgi:hypothetical protein